MPSKHRNRSKHRAEPVAHELPVAAATGEPTAVKLTGDRLALWDSIHARYELEAASVALLRNACEASERAAQLAEQVSRDGATFKDRFGQVRVNPAAQLERDFRGLAERALSKLAVRLES